MYNFSVLPDGNEPAAGLIDVDGTLYGTTAWGGGYGHGAAFSITSSGTEKVLHSFGKGTDGYYPQAGLIDVGGTLYGTTEYGGSGSCSNDFYHGCGTVFSITTGGKEKVLHSFSDAGAQGSNPLAGLIDVGGRSTARHFKAATVAAERSSESRRAVLRKCCTTSAWAPMAVIPWQP